MHKRRTALLRAVCVAAMVCLGALVPGAASAAEPAETLAANNWVYNATSLGIGVMRNWDGDYDQGKYDAVLPPGKFSDIQFGWKDETRGVYIGPGFRGEIKNLETGNMTPYGCSTTGHQIHLRAFNNYRVQNVSRC